MSQIKQAAATAIAAGTGARFSARRASEAAAADAAIEIAAEARRSRSAPFSVSELARFTEVLETVKMGRAWVLTEVACGNFPQFAKIDSYLLWRWAEVQKWVDERLTRCTRYPKDSGVWPNGAIGADRSITVDEVAALLSVSVSTVWRRVSAGELPGSIKLGSRTLWSWGEVTTCIADRFEAAQAAQAAQQAA